MLTPDSPTHRHVSNLIVPQQYLTFAPDLAIYYIFCDLVLIFQIFYYRRPRSPNTETTALLPTTSKPSWKRLAVYLACLCFVTLFGVLGWVLNKPNGKAPTEQEFWEDKAQIVGWISAVLYRESFLF